MTSEHLADLVLISADVPWAVHAMYLTVWKVSTWVRLCISVNTNMLLYFFVCLKQFPTVRTFTLVYCCCVFLHRSKRCGYCSPDLPDFVQLVEEEDERLFRRITNNSSHVLRGLLPPPSMATQQYSLRRRPHDRQMPDHTGHLADKNFLIRMLYIDSYWLFLYCNSVLSVSICVLSYVNKEMIDWLYMVFYVGVVNVVMTQHLVPPTSDICTVSLHCEFCCAQPHYMMS